jgi:hypothetical protein
MTLRSAQFDFADRRTVLVWGDADGMRELRDFLREVRTATAPRALNSFCIAIDGKGITVVPMSDRRENGMYVRKDHLEWKLDRTAADDFAEMVDELTEVSDGHQYLDSRGDEVQVMVSTGEYPADMRP